MLYQHEYLAMEWVQIGEGLTESGRLDEAKESKRPEIRHLLEAIIDCKISQNDL